MKPLLAKELMTPTLYTVPPVMTLGDLVDFLRENEVHAALVQEGERLVGVVSLTDVMTYLSDESISSSHSFSRLFSSDDDEDGEDVEEMRSAFAAVTVREVMTPSVVTCAGDASAGEVARLMQEKSIHRVVVMDGGRAAGVLSSTDLLVAVSRYEEALRTPAGQ